MNESDQLNTQPENLGVEDKEEEPSVSRRNLLKSGVVGAVGLAATASTISSRNDKTKPPLSTGKHDIDTSKFDPTAYLSSFDYGVSSILPSGQTQREYNITATDREIEVAPGVYFNAWTYNGTVPGPTIRCTEGDRLKVNFYNAGTHPHTIHFHGIHASNMDGAFEAVEPGENFIYEFDAAPMGFHLYHCHTRPLKRHLHKGLYGAFIIDPVEGRPDANELVMLMNGFDTNFDGENEVYAVNSVAFHYEKHPIDIQQGELVRIYCGNMTEFDLLNSFHLHGNMFKLFRTGTNLQQHEITDTVMLCQGERAVIEFTYEHLGKFMFHAHQSEFAELGWMGVFNVKESTLA